MKPIYYRIFLLVTCICIFALCFYKLSDRYDPLARYPYKTEENESIILEHFNADEIDYMINQHIKPEEFLGFVDVKGFDLRQTRSYQIALEAQSADKEYIVNFINKYHSHFRRDELKDLLTHYTYLDLTTFYENEQVLDDQLILVKNPSSFKTVLKENQTVYKYYPNVVQWNEIKIQESMIADLEEMRNAYSTMLNGEILNISQGTMSYDDLEKNYATQQILYLEDTDLFYKPGGQSEFQLGLSIATEYAQLWNDTCYSYMDEDKNVDYRMVEESLSQEARNQIVWLEENAYRYGFVVRYPMDKENETHCAYQPFVLRYVGKNQAKKMYKNHEVLEQVNTKEWKE